MTEKDRGSNVFELYAVRSADARQQGEKMDYYACGVSPIDELRGSEEWLRIHREPGRQIEMIRYADMLKLYSPIPQMLAILCEDCSITLEGRYLDVITFHIQNRTLQGLYLYEPEIYHEPRTDEPVIMSISREPELLLDDDEMENTETPEP